MEPPNASPLNSLFDAIRGGDSSAFSHYYNNSFDRLVTLTKRITKDEEEARNIAQDTLTKLWEQRESIDPTQSLDGFVATMAWNSSLNYLKKQRVHSKYHSEQLYLLNEEDASCDERLVARETAHRIQKVINEMSPQRRKVYELSRDENLTYNQIAERLGISYNAVRNYMSTTLDYLRSTLVIIFLFPVFVKK
ncbi:MAG: RNA polymerase sigma-70 factor [Prevotellaceae bacterium]|jgi:RNA polymerase sigma-70 factor (ECF subfamily)|nr:RNA polymerase sigma-70 factor [Prevotellaceae bacterium]